VLKLGKILKDVLIYSTSVLRILDFLSLFILQTDTSDQEVGTVFSQRDNNGEDHPVAYYNKQLLSKELYYSTVEKECLAIRLATHSFQVYQWEDHLSFKLIIVLCSGLIVSRTVIQDWPDGIRHYSHINLL